MNFFTTYVSQLFTGISTETVPTVRPWTPWIFTARSLDRASQGTSYVSTPGICSGWSCSTWSLSLICLFCGWGGEYKKAVPKQLARAASKKVVSVPDRNTKPNHTHTHTHTQRHAHGVLQVVARAFQLRQRGETANCECQRCTWHANVQAKPSQARQAGRQTEAMPSPMVMLSVLYVNIYNS